MNNRETLYDGALSAAWGYLFLNLNISFGKLNILPEFGGYLLLLSAINSWSVERRDLLLLRPIGKLLVVWSGIDWVMNLIWGISIYELTGLWQFGNLLAGVAAMYFHFQFLTDSAAIAAEYQAPDGQLDQTILRRRTWMVVLTTVVMLNILLRDWLGDGCFMALAVIRVIIGISVVMAMFALRWELAGDANPPSDDDTAAPALPEKDQTEEQ